MVRRHPHVFGNKLVGSAKDVNASWENLKKNEKKERNEVDTLRRIPKAFPSLLRASKVLKKAEELYYTREKEAEIISSMCYAIEDLRNVNKEENSLRSKQLIGQLMLQITKLARGYRVDTEDALNEALEGYIDSLEGKNK